MTGSRAMPRAFIALVLLFLVTSVLRADGYEEQVLDNGLRVILIQHRANPMVASSVIVGAGVIHEPEGMNGASHFLEHLLFNGTETRTQRELYDEVDRFGAYNNATTREDHTLFTLLIQKEYAEAGLAIQADMLFHSTLPEDKFEKEKGIVEEEIAKDRNDPAYMADEAFRSFAYAATPLARPVLGTEASIAAMKREDVLRYYKQRYVASNMILIVMGDFESSAMRESVRRTFGSAPRGSVGAATETAWPKRPEKNFATRPLDAGRTYLAAAFPLPIPPHDTRMAAIELLLEALASGEDSPLSRSLASGSDPLVLSFSLGVNQRAAPWSTVEFQAILPPGRDPVEILERLAEGLRAGKSGAARDRIATIRAGAAADEVLAADQIHYYGMMRAAYLPGSPPGYLSRRLQILRGLGGDALDLAAEALSEGIRSMRVLVAGKGLPEGATTWVPRPASASSRSPRRRIDEILPSGLQVILERNDDSQVFAAHLMLRPRAASEPEGKDGIADFLHRLLLKGTIVHDSAALSARLAELGARIKLVDDPSVPFDDDYTTPEFSFLRLEMPAERWREGIALLGEVVRFPRLAEEDVEAVRSEMLDLLSRRGESTRAISQDLVARTLAPSHPLSRPVSGTRESISSITSADLRAFHQSYVTGSHAIVTVIAPVEPEDVLLGLESALGDLPAGTTPPRVSPPPPTPSGLTAEAAVGKDQAYVTLAYVLDVEVTDRPALAVAGALLSDALSFHLREEQGLAYSIGAGFRSFGGRVRFETVMATRQANVETALAGLRQGITDFSRSAPDAAAVERAANSLRGRLLMRRLTRINQAYFLGLARLEGRSPDDDLARLESMRKVTPADVQRVLRKYVDVARCATIVVR